MDRRFDITNHTADIGITAYGKDLADLMSNAAYGMLTLIVEPETVKSTVTGKIELEELDDVALLVEWLNALLYEMDVNRLLFKEFDIVVTGQTKLAAVCRGERLDLARHRLKREVKAATYHNLRIVNEKGIYIARIIFDI
ncbi:MAG: archease [Chloroflexi bacterium]|nr:archease [Chloroflexota bacterium]